MSRELTETLVLEQIVQRMPRGNCSSYRMIRGISSEDEREDFITEDEMRRK